MTSSRYLVARVAQAFGYVRRAQRMADAASEMHLLREAEAQLGAAIWEKVENIEALSVEYWNLRKLVKESDKKCESDSPSARRNSTKPTRNVPKSSTTSPRSTRNFSISGWRCSPNSKNSPISVTRW
jgi:hypothetical protein